MNKQIMNSIIIQVRTPSTCIITEQLKKYLKQINENQMKINRLTFIDILPIIEIESYGNQKLKIFRNFLRYVFLLAHE